MKQFLQQVILKNIFFLLGAAWLFTIAFILNNYWYSSSTARYLHKHIQEDIINQEKDFKKILDDSILLRQLVSESYSQQQLIKLTDKTPYCIFLYTDDIYGNIELRFWNSQLALPGNDLVYSKDSERMVKLRNGEYEFIRRQLVLGNGQKLLAIALVPIRREYYIQARNLQTEFVNYPDAEKRVSITDSKTDYPVKSISGKILFWLQPKTVSARESANWVTLTLNIIGLVLLLLVVHNGAHYISDTYGYLRGIAFLVGIVCFLRGLTYIFPAMIDLRQFDLFDPGIYSSSKMLSSLGDLLINAFLFCWIILFVRREVGEKRFRLPATQSWHWFTLAGPLVFLVAMTFIFSSIIRSLIADGRRISFNVTNFFSLDVYSFVGFVVLGTLALSYFFLSQIILQLVLPLLSAHRPYMLFVIIVVTGLVMLSIVPDISFVQLNIYVLLWLLIYVAFMRYQLVSGGGIRLGVSEVLVWLFIFSLSISAIIIIENQRIELEQRKNTAETLSMQSDPSSELLLSIALTYFDNEFLYNNFYRFRSANSNSGLKDSLINRNFSAYLNKYDTRIYTFDSSDIPKPLFNEGPVSYDTLNTIFRVEGRPTNVPDLRYFSKSFDKFSYIYRKAVTDPHGSTVGYFFVLSEPKRYKNDALIPELFKPQNQPLPEYSPSSAYAVYSKGSLIDYYNEYEFPTSLSPSQIPKTEFEQHRRGDYDELWYHDNDRVVIIARKDNYLIEGMTLFAWLFSTFLVLLFAFRVISVMIQTRLRLKLLKQYFQVNLRSQIHGTFLLITLLSFIVIGVATIFFFVNRYKRNNIDRLSKAIQIMNNQVQTEIARQDVFDDLVKFYEAGTNETLEQLAQRVAEIHGTDINFYDLNGNLVVSSNLVVYNKGVLSDKMNPMAYYSLHHRNMILFITDEQMGKVSYQSIYSPVRGADGKAYAYLNIPSFDSQQELKREISNFLVTIINLNAFIFLIAGAIALLITNRITSSFTLIGDKMRAVNIGGANEEIPWHRNDEIGGLVKEYNKMVNKLGESAAQLAKSEREGAWREMARQVAHEIKNPLTPMKLSIQYLQKAIDNNSPNIKEMTASVASTLVEQIDHLSRIAADFSQFANIGNPKNEVFDLHEMLRSLLLLYDSSDHLHFSWKPVPNRIMLFADKTQLNRLFTNLLQNAVEACTVDSCRVEMTESLNGEYIIVSVTDNGEGIPVGVQEKIFTPNFTTKSSGTGLGLAMSKTIVEQAKGELWFETTVGEGTSFFVKLPLLRAT